MTRASATAQGVGQTDTAKLLATTNLINYAAPPLCFGFWFKPVTTVGTRTYFGLRNSGSNANLTFTASNTYQGSDGTNSFSITAGTENSNAWHFCLIREVSTSNRWVSVFEQSTGKITHTNDTTALTWADTPDTFNLCSLANSASSLGAIDMSEFWYTDADVQGLTSQINDGLFWWLANYGPFSIPSVVPNIVEYRALRFDPTANTNPVEYYTRSNKAAPAWTASITLNDAGSAAISEGSLPSLSGQYIRPRQYMKILEV